jgi:hypothetical protein
MAFEALNLCMPPGQGKARTRMAIHGKSCDGKAGFGMAEIALIVVWFAGEFSPMRVGVAFGTLMFPCHGYRFGAFRLVTFFARHVRMLSHKRKPTTGMICTVKKQ